MPRTALRCSKNPLSLLLYSSCLMNTLTDNSSRLSSIRSFPVVHVFQKSVQNTIRSSKNPQEPFCSWNSCLLALWLILSLVILLASLFIIILSPFSICCECSQSSIISYNSFFRLRRHSKRELDLDLSNCHRLYPWGYSTYPSLIRAFASDPLIWKS